MCQSKSNNCFFQESDSKEIRVVSPTASCTNPSKVQWPGTSGALAAVTEDPKTGVPKAKITAAARTNG